jgi:hypothetical protein
MQYLAELSKVVYQAKDGTEEKVFHAPVSSTGQALEWLVPPAGMLPHPGQGETDGASSYQISNKLLSYPQ